MVARKQSPTFTAVTFASPNCIVMIGHYIFNQASSVALGTETSAYSVLVHIKISQHLLDE